MDKGFLRRQSKLGELAGCFQYHCVEIVEDEMWATKVLGGRVC